MKITKFKHKEVEKNGIIKSGGAVITKGGIIIVKGSCDLLGCHCSDGYFLSIVLPLKNKIVEGIEVRFKDYKEMKNELKLKKGN